jgi:hypothetical protein
MVVGERDLESRDDDEEEQLLFGVEVEGTRAEE